MRDSERRRGDGRLKTAGPGFLPGPFLFFRFYQRTIGCIVDGVAQSGKLFAQCIGSGKIFLLARGLSLVHQLLNIIGHCRLSLGHDAEDIGDEREK